MLTPSEIARFHGKYRPNSSGCALWAGPLDKDGYGTFYLRGRGRRAHRVAWFLARGPIPVGMVINHICPHRHCVNAQHLETVTVRENSLKDSRSPAAVNARKTHCPKGHAYDATERSHGGRIRICSICRREKQNRARRVRVSRTDPLKGMV